MDSYKGTLTLLILIEDISDHQPSLILLRQTKLYDKKPPEFESRNLNDVKIKRIKTLLLQVNWLSELNSGDCNKDFNRFCNVVSETMDKVAPCFVELWMTKGLEEVSRTKKRLYKKTLTPTVTRDDIEKYKTHRNIYNKLKHELRVNYHKTKCTDYKNITRKLWQLINSAISKTKHTGSIIPDITIDGLKTYDP